MIHRSSPETSDLAGLRDKALGLRESVNGARARLHNQRETLRRLRAELSELKELARAGVPVAAAAPLAAPAARKRAAAARWLPYAALAVFAVASRAPERRPEAPAAVAEAARPPRVEPAAEAAADDDRGDEAIALVHEWRVPGDDRPVVERLQRDPAPPGARPAWSVERTGEATYRVSFRPARAESALEFDVDLDARRVEPSPGTAELLAPRLTARR